MVCNLWDDACARDLHLAGETGYSFMGTFVGTAGRRFVHSMVCRAQQLLSDLPIAILDAAGGYCPLRGVAVRLVFRERHGFPFAREAENDGFRPSGYVHLSDPLSIAHVLGAGCPEKTARRADVDFTGYTGPAQCSDYRNGNDVAFRGMEPESNKIPLMRSYNAEKLG